jgi:hypothetical protein
MTRNIATCWCDLFKSAVVALEPGKDLNGDYWLHVSFEIMLKLAAVEYPLKVDQGIILMGYSTALIPVKVVNGKHVLWHLEIAGHNSQLTVAELKATNSQWLQVESLEELRKMDALVGWCPEATVLLGTDKLKPSSAWSGTAAKKKTWHWTGVNLQLIAQSAAPIQVGGQLGFTLDRRLNTVHFSPSNNYLKCLTSRATEVIVLYDVETKRAWLVPLLSVFHHMLLVYWDIIPEYSRKAQLPLVAPSADGGKASLKALKENGEWILEASGSEHLTIRDLVMGFSVNLSKTFLQPSRGSEIYGYELMDIVMDSPMAELKRRKIGRVGLGWNQLLSQVKCLFCSGVGDVIYGSRAIDDNSSCNRLPHGLDLMAATLRAIENLSMQSGSLLKSPLCRLSSKHVYLVTGTPFTRCQHTGTSQVSCWNILHISKYRPGKDGSTSQPSLRGTQWVNGAIVFGRQKKGISSFSPLKIDDAEPNQTITIHEVYERRVLTELLP